MWWQKVVKWADKGLWRAPAQVLFVANRYRRSPKGRSEIIQRTDSTGYRYSGLP